MPSLTINPPQHQPPYPSSFSSSPPAEKQFTFSAPPPSNVTFLPPEASSPVAPEYSPITPKVQPALPAAQNAVSLPPEPANMQPPMLSTQPITSDQHEPPSAPTANYIPQPPPQPFSSEDSTDAIALRAAISALQFQKKQARDDLHTLEATKREALLDPQRFRDELAAGRLQEHRPQLGGLQAILDQADSDDDDDDEDDGKQAAVGASPKTRMSTNEDASPEDIRPAEVPDSQPSRPGTATSTKKQDNDSANKRPTSFSRIPGPQNVVRMPNVNWGKYHIVGEPLEKMHEHQRRWPGNFAYEQDQGRDYAVAAPYSPFTDVLDAQNGQDATRKDSLAPTSALATLTGTISEHPMETRRSSNKRM